jgi:SAM-dependent methyltransferase
MYSAELARIHDQHFGAYAERVAPDIIALLRANGLGTGLVVEVGCGGGKLAQRLVNAGYDVHGIDISRAMIAIARARVKGSTFRVGSITSTRIPACAAIVGVGEVVTYLPRGLPSLKRFFERARRALHPGGLLVFDFIESARRRTYSEKTTSGKNWKLVVNATFEPESRVLTRRIAIVRRVGQRQRASSEIHRVRVYSRQELTSALESAGFACVMKRSFGRAQLLSGNVAVIALKV